MTAIRLLNASDAREAIPDLCEILSDCVNGGASVGFMLPFDLETARPFWEGVANAVEAGDSLLLVAEHQGTVVGTVQIGLKQPPNQPHRADLKKLLVHRSARGLGLARQLMEASQHQAARAGKTLIVLDTATGEPAEAIYEKLGWTRAGVVPDYALFPDGRFCDTTIFYKRVGSL
ncbi:MULTISPECIES: GNAT family N-acetyltransferase [Rhizobium/Agrobacterium group]|uniref:GNAT family N-acetyltransferase n=1 Tax=Rhizobium/Agrobacterium group TaxID=227290 RepID=UPI000B3FF410|nr:MULTISPECIES: GNAT family N-acetyltransferase [Rhizobium/Agrobacterium group]MCF1483059.1 GNAT family N-acetyltransferase [Allorhizobium ampelinum]NSZ41242.1 GNAT family N-acetyltransferase [Agrobacterium vitis]NTA24925.1 GNAT family N-acetyltransferase [Allorhizobium ampelinum]OVE98122.1 GNAT family N-acetyltransferase [Allorhizobium ampelinum]